jgi:hypothetical protein
MGTYVTRDPRWNEEIDEFIYKAGWDAKFIGLGSVPQKDISVAAGNVSIPQHYTNLGSVYYRKTKPRDLRQALRGSEEFLNFHLDLLCSIAASDVLNQLMFASFGFDDRGPWKK